MNTVTINIPRVEVSRIEKMSRDEDGGRQAVFFVVAPMQSEGNSSWFDAIHILPDLYKSAREADLNLNKALYVEVQEGDLLVRDKQGNLILTKNPEKGHRFKTGTLIWNGQFKRWDKLPSFDVDSATEDFSQLDLFAYMCEIARRHIKGLDQQSMLEFFGIDEEEESLEKAA